ncbi:cupin domain-containing protein [Fibrella forsythiae]|uniref:Cupin domain-containing protein n=1 Tax=Fibrella forsythiae TaxID=2817061 RepID=A0ABS3JNB9_9BACT|nr:cupin domain-containing protein [Fibrella forsythiae]MBO0951483.1 cupin domain-containing protein [Fibrella forsythiae]
MKRRQFLTASIASTALGTAVTNSLAGQPTTPPPTGFIVKAGEARFGQHTPFKGINPNDLKLSAKDTNGALAMFEYTGNEKTGPSLHVHLDQDETFYVIEGTYRFQVGTETLLARPGDTIFGPRNVPHTWIQLSDTGKLVYSVQPAGKLEAFFTLMSQMTSPPTAQESETIHRAHGMKVLGPPLSLK